MASKCSLVLLCAFQIDFLNKLNLDFVPEILYMRVSL